MQGTYSSVCMCCNAHMYLILAIDLRDLIVRLQMKSENRIIIHAILFVKLHCVLTAGPAVGHHCAACCLLLPHFLPFPACQNKRTGKKHVWLWKNFLFHNEAALHFVTGEVKYVDALLYNNPRVLVSTPWAVYIYIKLKMKMTQAGVWHSLDCVCGLVLAPCLSSEI